ncbi:MAG: glutamyl-tRNA reductase, partial [Planctomycetaceae bacterium]|nr:glutamyl-tRNA reductase [Planctomycetaceae bacterium]
MNVQVIYCTHQTADLGLRERLAFSDKEQLCEAYGVLRTEFPASDFVVLSTCNRVEVYATQEDPENALATGQIADFFSRFHKLPSDAFVGGLLERSGPEAVRHLFEVVSSLDSMVLGEPQIVSQVKEAYDVSQQNEACGPLTSVLFQQAIRVSRRVRSETGLSSGRVSIASVAVGDFGRSIFDSFHDKTVLVIGAGEMAEETLRYLTDEGVREIVVCNRSAERGGRLAAEFGGHYEPLDDLDHWMTRADVIVSTTGAAVPIVDAARFRKVREAADWRPVFILDLGAPRDFDPAVNDLDDNVFLYDIDDLEATCERNRNRRVKEIELARSIISEETERFMHDIYHRATGPIIRRL